MRTEGLLTGRRRSGRKGRGARATWLGLLGVAGFAVGAAGSGPPTGPGAGEKTVSTPYVVLVANDLGMHCMQQDFSEFLILPPFNTVHAQVIDRSGEHPHIVTSGVTVDFAIPGNTTATDKTNWWTYDQALLGVDFAPDVGLTGNGLAGVLSPTGRKDYSITGVPLTPIDDNGLENPYPLATVTVTRNGAEVARTQAVVPVSWEVNCSLCHNAPGISPGTDILRAHDRMHGTELEANQPVFCAGCHADPALGAPGDPDLPTFSAAMHGAHADRMDQVELENDCYACHPGLRTQCQRDVHYANGIFCTDCHGGMEAVGDPSRTPWADQPRCDDCHSRPGFEFEQPGTLYRDSKGHSGVFCYACHGSPHAITPTVTEQDNLQAINLQGHAGVIDQCIVCHSQDEGDPFFHRVDDD
ncbi:MAG: hypothetical protein IT431_00575 [Phycisphaerales bacterium]|nr:hypothetical protein [Phycisphaerales bacterium]